MTYRYKLDGIPPSNNRFIGRENRWEYQKIKKEWAQLIACTCLPKPPKPIQRAVVRIMYHFKDKRRRDPDNYSGKMILDGLVRAGIIADDSFFCIDLQLAASYDNGGYTEILIEEEHDEQHNDNRTADSRPRIKNHAERNKCNAVQRCG